MQISEEQWQGTGAKLSPDWSPKVGAKSTVFCSNERQAKGGKPVHEKFFVQAAGTFLWR